MINISIAGVSCSMELDTGAELPAIPSSMRSERFDKPLRKSSASLSAYGGQALRVVGEADVEVVYQNQVFHDTVVVVEARGHALFGRNWLGKVRLDWKSIGAVHCSLSTDARSADVAADILSEYPQVFQEGLDTIKDRTAPLPCKARRLRSAAQPDQGQVVSDSLFHFPPKCCR